MGYGIDERRISAGTNGDPLVGPRRHRVAVARIDDDDLCTALLERLFQVWYVGPAPPAFVSTSSRRTSRRASRSRCRSSSWRHACRTDTEGRRISGAELAAVAPQASAVHVDETRKNDPMLLALTRSAQHSDSRWLQDRIRRDTLIVIGNGRGRRPRPGNLLELAFAGCVCRRASPGKTSGRDD